MSSSFFNPNGKIFTIDDACPLCWVFTGILGAIISIALLFFEAQWWVTLIGLIISGICFQYGWSNKDKNTKYIINSRNDTFFIPLEDEPYCRLSDIDAVNKRHESRKVRKSYTEDGKTKYRTETEYTYYVQIIGERISTDFSFDYQGKRDNLYSSLKIGIKDVQNFLDNQKIENDITRKPSEAESSC